MLKIDIEEYGELAVRRLSPTETNQNFFLPFLLFTPFIHLFFFFYS